MELNGKDSRIRFMETKILVTPKILIIGSIKLVTIVTREAISFTNSDTKRKEKKENKNNNKNMEIFKMKLRNSWNGF